jgi:hypothetical protein
VLFAGRMRRFAGTCLAQFAPSMRRNRRGSQVSRAMFSRPYSEEQERHVHESIKKLGVTCLFGVECASQSVCPRWEDPS